MGAARVAASLPAGARKQRKQTGHPAGKNLCPPLTRRPQKRLWPLALLLLQVFACSVLLGGRRHGVVVAARVTEDVELKGETFSPQWLEKYRGEKLGCDAGRGSYVWRHNGFGSNINNMLNAWVYALVVNGWSDVSLVCGDTQLENVDCSHESEGLVPNGWRCLFSSMPHLCRFRTAKNWANYMIASRVSEEDRQEANRLTMHTVRDSEVDILNSLQALDIDLLGALAVMANYLWGYLAPWLRKDLDFVAAYVEETFLGSPFLGIHVRRGDKITTGEGESFDVEEYLAAAVDHLGENDTPTAVDDIKGILVASDNAMIVDEVRDLAHAYFPSVRRETVVFVADGVPGGVQNTGMTTQTRNQGYGSFVYLFADIEQLAAADIFVGTFSSNVGRLVVVLREGLGKERNSSISLDKPWEPVRSRI